jgi:hypothetical protein
MAPLPQTKPANARTYHDSCGAQTAIKERPYAWRKFDQYWQYGQAAYTHTRARAHTCRLSTNISNIRSCTLARLRFIAAVPNCATLRANELNFGTRRAQKKTCIQLSQREQWIVTLLKQRKYYFAYSWNGREISVLCTVWLDLMSLFLRSPFGETNETYEVKVIRLKPWRMCKIDTGRMATLLFSLCVQCNITSQTF